LYEILVEEVRVEGEGLYEILVEEVRGGSEERVCMRF